MGFDFSIIPYQKNLTKEMVLKDENLEVKDYSDAVFVTLKGTDDSMYIYITEDGVLAFARNSFSPTLADYLFEHYGVMFDGHDLDDYYGDLSLSFKAEKDEKESGWKVLIHSYSKFMLDKGCRAPMLEIIYLLSKDAYNKAYCKWGDDCFGRSTSQETINNEPKIEVR